jgi:hypothetical protein
MMSLEPVQADLLRTLVQASRDVPRDQREKFHCFTAGGQFHIMHPGLPDRELIVYEGDIDTLDAEGLLNVSYSHQPGTRSFDVSPLGLRLYGDLQNRSGAPAQQLEENLKRYLDADAFQRKHPTAYRKWADAAQLLWASDSQEQLTMIGHLCREAIQEFAAELVDRYQPSGLDFDKAGDVAKIRAVLDQHKSRLGTTLVPLLDALLVYWGTTSDLVQRQEHGAQKEGKQLVWEDGRRVVFHTAIVMFEIDQALS